MTLSLWTDRLSYGRPDRLDITRSAVDEAEEKRLAAPEGAPFAPSHAILDPALRALRYAAAFRARGQYAEALRVETPAWRLYCKQYREEMLRSYRERRAAWDALLAHSERTLVCFCEITPERPLCHRVLLAEFLTKLGAKYEGERGAGVQLELGGVRRG